MTEKRQKLTAENVARIAATIFGMPVEKVTAPGGKSRESLRIHFPVKTVMATQRAYAGRMRLEVEVLRRLTAEGAPVPGFLGGNEQLFFQDDVGSKRLSGALAYSARPEQIDVAERSIKSLIGIHKAGDRAGLSDTVPALGAEKDWVRGFVATANPTSKRFGIAAPLIDIEAVTGRLHVPAERFLKWDARPGNASIGADRQVYWFDWEHCGKRQGTEDFAWLAGDEFWPLDAEAVVDILERNLPKESKSADLDYLSHFITFHIVQRLAVIHRRFLKVGWVDAAAALKHDKIGVDPDLMVRLCRHGAGWADRSDLTRPMVKWFEDCERAAPGLVRPEKKEE